LLNFRKRACSVGAVVQAEGIAPPTADARGRALYERARIRDAC
jgi:hypothetical protein